MSQTKAAGGITAVQSSALLGSDELSSCSESNSTEQPQATALLRSASALYPQISIVTGRCQVSTEVEQITNGGMYGYPTHAMGKARQLAYEFLDEILGTGSAKR